MKDAWQQVTWQHLCVGQGVVPADEERLGELHVLLLVVHDEQLLANLLPSPRKTITNSSGDLIWSRNGAPPARKEMRGHWANGQVVLDVSLQGERGQGQRSVSEGMRGVANQCQMGKASNA